LLGFLERFLGFSVVHQAFELVDLLLNITSVEEPGIEDGLAFLFIFL
jgi:hypothetical protein